MSRRRSRIDVTEEDTELNMTPMLDVVKPFAEEDQPWAPTILVGVNEIDEIWIADQPYEVGEVRPILQSLKDETPEATAIIIGDREASSGVIWEVQELMQDLEIQARVSTK